MRKSETANSFSSMEKMHRMTMQELDRLIVTERQQEVLVALIVSSV